MFSKLKRFDHWLDSHFLVWILLAVMAVLRLPNFFEPYWYGDEGIYLAIGTALRHGGILYQTIVDHKTPLIYYLAMVPSLVSFRVLLFIFSSVSILGFYILSFRFLKSFLSRAVAGALFLLLTTLPWFEGHVANGEQFVMGFVLLGWTFISLTPIFDHFSKNKTEKILTKPLHPTKQNLLYSLYFFIAGLCFGLALLTKVPALFDAVAVALFFWWVWLRQIEVKKFKQFTYWKTQFIHLVSSAGVFGVGLLLPLLISVLYFIARGAGNDYLQFGLLYNFHYASNWGLPFTNPLLVWLFTLQGKFLIVILVLGVLTLGSRLFSSTVLFAAGWFILALFASLLSNRPYPHYYIQVLPPLALLAGASIDSVRHLWKKYHFHRALIDLAPSLLLIALFVGVLGLLRVGLYSVSDYYGNFTKLVTKQMSAEEYRNSFNSVLADNYDAAPLLSTVENNQLFIWGTNPSLYALTRTVPVGRFTVSFHIKDLQAYDETYAAVTQVKPEYIVVMRDETSSFPKLNNWLSQNYIPNHNYDYFVVWKRL